MAQLDRALDYGAETAGARQRRPSHFQRVTARERQPALASNVLVGTSIGTTG
jgi:hypothetical protein